MKLFDISKDPAERRNPAAQKPEKARELDERLTAYLTAVNAQLPQPNPNFDPAKPTETKRGAGTRKAAQSFVGLHRCCVPSWQFKKEEPAEIVLPGLQPDTQHFYQLRLAQTNSANFPFHTARPPGSSFTFTITADSHLDENTDALIYQRTLANALADRPDCHVDLGDTSMTDKHPSPEAAAKQYLAQRFYFDQLCAVAPRASPGNGRPRAGQRPRRNHQRRDEAQGPDREDAPWQLADGGSLILGWP